MKGNITNIDFPDCFLSDMTTKEILLKWVEYIYSDIKYSLFKYYMKDNNEDAGDMWLTKNMFKKTMNEIYTLGPVFQDMTLPCVYGMKDIFSLTYGNESDELYALNKFLDLHNSIANWNALGMWNNCSNDKRLFNICKNG